jgi:DNA-directed RNA polymerase specialized sigma24 family protein
VITEDGFDEFVRAANPRLRRALLGAVGADRVDDAVAEAFAWGYEHRDELSAMENPVGYLYRVGQSKVRYRRPVRLFRVLPPTIPEVEPGLVDALGALPDSQRTAIWLAHGCGWTHGEIAIVMDVAPSTVATHVSRGLRRLREVMGVVDAQS